MTRSLNAGMATAVAASEGYADVWLLSLESSAGTLYFNNTPQALLFDGNTYLGVGGAFEFEPPQETGDLAAQGLRMSLSGVTQTVISSLLSNHYRGRTCILLFGQLLVSTGLIADAPLVVFNGLLNENWEVTEEVVPEGAPGTVRITTTAVSGLARYLFPRGVHTNVVSHNDMLDRASLTTGDDFFRLIPELFGKKLVWGKGASRTGTSNNLEKENVDIDEE